MELPAGGIGAHPQPRPYPINRVPLSGNLDLCRQMGFPELVVESALPTDLLPVQRLAKDFRDLGARDWGTHMANVLFRLPG